jgi:hypothetical protein
MHPFITFREPLPDGEMGYFILQRAWPHYVGRIVTSGAENFLVAGQVPHHTMWVTFNGVLQGNLLPAHEQAVREATETMVRMAQWFSEERISPQPKKYAKWHFNHPSINS